MALLAVEAGTVRIKVFSGGAGIEGVVQHRG